MVLKNNVGQNFIYRCSNGTLERTTWGKTLFTAVQMVLKNNVGQNFISCCSNGT